LPHGRPFNLAGVAPQLGRIAIAQGCPRCDKFSTSLANFSETEEFTVRYESGLLEELASGCCERPLIVFILAFRNCPGSLILVGLVGATSMDEKYFDPVLLPSTHQ
jgi:hypothetical protein